MCKHDVSPVELGGRMVVQRFLNRNLLWKSLCTFLILNATGCGGGGSDSSTAPSSTPTICTVSGVPSISQVTGALSNGQTVTITGSGFGNCGPTVVLFDDFEKGTNGNPISTASGSAQVGHWTAVEDIPHNPRYSTAYRHSGSNCFLADQSTGDGGHWAVVNFPGTYFVYASYWVFLPSDREVPGTGESLGPNWKLADITGGNYLAGEYASNWTAGVVLGDLSLAPGTFQLPNPWHDAAGLTELGYGSTSWAKGQWHRFENFYAGGWSGNGIVQMWETNASHARTTVCDETNLNTIHPGDTWSWFRLHAYARQDASGQCYYDDVYVATGPGARARVEIGNAPNYEDCTNLAIFTPTAWNETAINAQVRSGSFLAGQNAFLFVINASGTASAGYPLTMD